MAVEPITLFARKADPAGVARRLRELAPSLMIDGPDDSWRKAVVTFRKLWKKRTLTFTHDPAYYSEPNWSKQMSGMRGYLSNFADTERKERATVLPTSFHFSLATAFEPDFDPKGDQRLEVLYAVAELLDGVLFTPSSIRDARGRILFGTGGEDMEDPNAVWPKVFGEIPTSDPTWAEMHEISRPKPPEQLDEGADPPTAHRVTRRALAFTAITFRAILEQDAAKKLPTTADLYRDLLGWVKGLGIDDEFEPDEWKVLQRKPGKLDSRMQIDSTWRLESLVVLAWALGRFDIPPHDKLVDFHPLWKSLGILDVAAAKALLENPMVRTQAEIGTRRNQMFALHWRVQNYHLHSEVMDFAEFARTCCFGPLDISGLPLIKGDLALMGKRLDKASDDEVSMAKSIARERHQAVNWLWEGPKQFSLANTST